MTERIISRQDSSSLRVEVDTGLDRVEIDPEEPQLHQCSDPLSFNPWKKIVVGKIEKAPESLKVLAVKLLKSKGKGKPYACIGVANFVYEHNEEMLTK